MCGIAGILGAFRSDAGRALVGRMTDALAHRGPDAEGFHLVPGQAAIGHRRLSIIDVQHGAQPMLSDDGRYSLSFNGEIYNYLELRQALSRKGVEFKTFSDTEVLLRLLIADGVDCIPKLNGMFAFVFHDSADGSWIAARDHFGIKPFYYAQAEDQFVFASEIKAILLHPEISARRNESALHDYMTFQFCLANQTLFEGVSKLEPGHFLLGRGSRILQDVCYWDHDFTVDEYHTEDYFLDTLGHLLEDSVRLQVRSDVPLGSYVSGGIDSSLVALLAAGAIDQPLPIFHGRFSEGPAYDESRYARMVGEQMGGDYYEVVPGPKDFVESMPGLIFALDEPLAGPGVFPQFMVSRLAKEHVTVVLGGQGGDELFGGYARYLVGYLEQALKGAIHGTQEEGRHLVTLESVIPQLSLLKQYVPLLRHFWSRGVFDEMDSRYFHLIDRSGGVERSLASEFLAGFEKGEVFDRFREVFNSPNTTSYINKMTHFDMKTLLPALLQVEDRVSMAVSLESRVPLLDHRIVDLVTRIPPPLKFEGGRTKHLLKAASRNVLPDEVLHREDKMGFPVPLKEWMKGGVVRDFVGDTLLCDRSLTRGLYRPEELRRMLEDQGVGARALWGALCLELWHRRFIDAN